MKIYIVKFKNGEYAVMRKSFFSKQYKSLNSHCWWTEKHQVHYYCTGTFSEIEALYDKVTDEGVIIKWKTI